MSISDELLKAKELLDAGAITQEEYEQMKRKILNSDSTTSSSSSSSYSSTSYSSRPSSNYSSSSSSSPSTGSSGYHARRSYFNSKPFKATGWTCFTITAIFVLTVFILLLCYEYEVAMSLVWEFSFIPGVIAVSMGGILKNKEGSNALLFWGVFIFTLAIIISIVTTYYYIDDLSYSSYRYYYYSALK